MRPLFKQAGHAFYSPTYTGLGERAHLARSDIDLSTHIQDVLSVLEFEDLNDVILIGHSYGGMVATGVADNAAGRIRTLIYLDAFAPKNGQSLFDLVGPKVEANMRAGAARDGEGWKIPPIDPPPDTTPEDLAWTAPRRRPQPIKTFEQKIRLGSKTLPPRHYIYARKFRPGDGFRQFAERARTEPGWKCHEIEASHNPHITCPNLLMATLTQIMAGQS